MVDVKHIDRFGESDTEQWYEIEGVRIHCNEETIQRLWDVWVLAPGANRYKEGEHTIYEYGKSS